MDESSTSNSPSASTMSIHVVILAAGKGTRMHSSKIKILHEVAGRALIDRVVDMAKAINQVQAITPILGHDRERVQSHLSTDANTQVLSFAYQNEQLGTGHAVWQAAGAIRAQGASHVLVLSGDVPNLQPKTLRKFIAAYQAQDGDLGVMTALLDNPAKYGRIVRDEEGRMEGIVEWKDASEAQREIQEINTGIYLVSSSFALKALEEICANPPTNAQGEYYLTTIVEKAVEHDVGVMGWSLKDSREIQGVNTRADLAMAEHYAQTRARRDLLNQGVTMLDPASVFIDAGVSVAADVVIYPNVNLRGATTIGVGSVIEPNCFLRDAKVGESCQIKAGTYIDDAHVDDNSAIGPYAHLRPGADIGQSCKVGNFVEIKKTRLDDGAKASHLSYLGDAHIGAGANIGAGTITCNYDGKNKHHTEVGAGAFVGTNSSLVAPISIGKGAYVGAGSTITNSIPDGALGVARGRQRVIEGWVNRRRGSSEEE